MTSGHDLFWKRFYDELYPAFRSFGSRHSIQYDLQISPADVSEFDATNFLRSIDSGLVVLRKDGDYDCAIRRGYKDRIFNHGKVDVSPRPLKLSIEPIVSVGAIARLERFSTVMNHRGIPTGRDF